MSANFSGGGVKIRINEVEDIMRHVALATNYKYYDIDTSYNSTFRYDVTKEVLTSVGQENALYDIDVQDDASFNQARPYLERLRDAGLLFAAQYPTLQSLYDYGDTLAEPDKFSFYSSNTRMLVVYKLLGKPFESQTNHLINYYSGVGQTDTVNFLQALKDHLDTL